MGRGDILRQYSAEHLVQRKDFGVTAGKFGDKRQHLIQIGDFEKFFHSIVSNIR